MAGKYRHLTCSFKVFWLFKKSLTSYKGHPKQTSEKDARRITQNSRAHPLVSTGWARLEVAAKGSCTAPSE